LFTPEKNRTLWISRPELLSKILPFSSSPISPTSSSSSKISTEMPQNSKPVSNKAMGTEKSRTWIDQLRWSTMKKLRCPPPEPAYPVTPRSESFDIDDIRSLPFSDLDKWVRDTNTREEAGFAGEYRRIVTKCFLAQRFAFGFGVGVELVDFLIRVTLCGLGAWMVGTCEGGMDGRDGKNWDGGRVDMEWWKVLRLSVGVCGCHTYALLKGYR
jgi:hypothetical protein